MRTVGMKHEEVKPKRKSTPKKTTTGENGDATKQASAKSEAADKPATGENGDGA